MRTTPITPNVTQLARFRFVNAYLVRDVFTTYGRTAVTSHFYLRFPFAAMATWDKAADVEAARTLRALEPALLAVGHGPAVRDPVAAMDAAIELAASKLAPHA